jgi:isopentenyldiphosphate isomerase
MKIKVNTEVLRIFDKERRPIGTASREEVHRKGYWHEAFHCWFIQADHGTDYLILQVRSANKKDYPNLLDITAAGHLLANETVEDGVREVEEEIGIRVSTNELVSLGTVEYYVNGENFKDKEIALVFLYKSSQTWGEFTLQKEEVSGLVKVKWKDFAQLWTKGNARIDVSGFLLDKSGNRTLIDRLAGREDFVPHPISYYQNVIDGINKHLLRDL